MNFEIMTGLIAERVFVWVMLWMYVFFFFSWVVRSRASKDFWVFRGRVWGVDTGKLARWCR